MNPSSPDPLPRGLAAAVFLAFAFAYFFSALVRAITATLSPTLTQEFGLSARDLGLLAGGYFFGFSLTQLPLGRWLDRHGPKKVILAFLVLAVLGCLAFAGAGSFNGLLLARVLCGIGVSACLMAPLTGYRRWFSPTVQLRTNAWMLMSGSLGMLASTLPVQWLMPLWGWRAIFVALGAGIGLSMLLIWWIVPRWLAVSTPPAGLPTVPADDQGSYSAIWRSPYFWRLTPIGFFTYGGMVAIQTLWAAPWMTQVAGWSAQASATGLFFINLAMLLTFWTWGWVTPALARRGLGADRLITLGMPLNFVVLTVLVLLGPAVGDGAALLLALFCVTSSFVSLAQPAVGMAFDSHLAGRALSAYNLVIFAGVFVVQWGIGLGVDLALGLGLPVVAAYQSAMGVFGLLSLLSWLFFLRFRASVPARTVTPTQGR
jgi:predicted MFS family arabinose efflux permease